MSQRQAAEAMHNSLSGRRWASSSDAVKADAWRPSSCGFMSVKPYRAKLSARPFSSSKAGSKPKSSAESAANLIRSSRSSKPASLARLSRWRSASKVGKESMVPKLVARSGNVVIVLELVSISGKLSDVLRRSNAMPSYWQASLPIMTDSFKWHENVCWQGELGCRVVVVCELSSSWMPMSSIMGADEVWRTPVGPAAKSSAGLSP
mmetsp:Transcript_11126/g.27833  ORF Transcript_11126/g.27833 Transcript_11126/m.27833 type:complete len:206 (+) Transcript_11126:913-1530(+)